MRTVPSILVALGLLAGAAQAGEPGPDGALARVRALEVRQVELVERIAPAVCAVFPGAVGAGGGSGVVISPDGAVLTNFHVSGTNRRLNVGLPDGQVYKADLLGIDPTGDIALLQLLGDGPFPFAPLGDSAAVQVGDPVLCMGNPFLLATDFTPTVTRGFVSGLHRYRGSAEMLCYGDSIQIDASINPGNSGGPLFDFAGSVVGINGMIGIRHTRGRVNVGVGFAVASNQIRNFLADLRAGRLVQHGTLDATVADLPDPDAPEVTLVTLDQIDRDGVAAKAGLDLGDVVTVFDGQPVTSANRFLTLITALPAGRRVEVRWRRRAGPGAWTDSRAVLRLAGLPVSPKIRAAFQGPDPARLRRQTLSLLARHRLFAGTDGSGAAPLDASWTGTRVLLNPDGTERHRDAVTLALGPDRLRLAREGGEAAVLLAFAAGAGTLTPDGQGPRALTERECAELAGLLRVVAGLRAENPLDALPSVVFSGGDFLAGRFADRLEVDGESQGVPFSVSVYLDPEDGALLGLRWPSALLGGDAAATLSWGPAGGSGPPSSIEVERDDGTVLVRFSFAGATPQAPANLPPPRALAALVRTAWPGVVKVYGAGGILGIPGYATGIVLTPDGTILTADSVMLETPDLKVVLHDGRRLPARILRRDRRLGAALLKVEGRDLAVLPRAQGLDVEPGRFVLTLGNCFDIAVGEEKVSSSCGIVVAVGSLEMRAGVTDVPYGGKVILTDAAVNPGTQGGPMLDLDGRVLGMCGRVVESKTTNTQINYAIPLAELEAFIAGDEPAKAAPAPPPGPGDGDDRPLGIVFFDVSLLKSPPAFVDRVLDPSPARDAGLRRDDLILKVGDRTVHTVQECRQALWDATAGQRLVLSVKRGDEVLLLAVAVPADEGEGK